MVEHDLDDPPAQKRRWWKINEAQRAIFWATLPTNLFFLLVYVIAFTWLVPLLKGG